MAEVLANKQYANAADYVQDVARIKSEQQHTEHMALIDSATKVVIGGPHGPLPESNTFKAAGNFLIEQWRKSL